MTGSECRFANGPFVGKKLGEAWPKMPTEWAGTRADPSAAFPLLVKFIFPEEKLSVQVHPDDDYAARHEQAAGGRGKTEMWYALRARPGAEVFVGLKPSVGRLSTRGVVPACRSLDCVSIFALTTEDATAVLAVAQGFDAEDPFSRRIADRPLAGRRCGVPYGAQMQFFGDEEYARLFDQAIARVESLGGTIVRIDFAPFLDAARLLYGGPWVAERYAALEEFIRRRADAVHPVTREVIEKSTDFSAVDAFKGLYRLTALKRASERVWEAADLLLTPTAGTVYEIGRVEADPIRLNTNLGYYTNFMNLLDLAGVAVPTGFRTDGLPFGVTLVGRRGTDAALLEWAGRLHRASVQRLGALDLNMPPPIPGWQPVTDGPSGSSTAAASSRR